MATNQNQTGLTAEETSGVTVEEAACVMRRAAQTVVDMYAKYEQREAPKLLVQVAVDELKTALRQLTAREERESVTVHDWPRAP